MFNYDEERIAKANYTFKGTLDTIPRWVDEEDFEKREDYLEALVRYYQDKYANEEKTRYLLREIMEVISRG